MYCQKCGQELEEGSRYCGSCGAAQSEVAEESGASRKPAAPTVTLNRRTLLFAAVAVVVIIRLGQDKPSHGNRDRTPDQEQSQQNPDPDTDPNTYPEPNTDPAALVGTWTNKDGVGLRFTSDGVVKLSGFGLSLGTDKFTYEVTAENTVTLSANIADIFSSDFDCPYIILDNTLWIEIGDYSLELSKK